MKTTRKAMIFAASLLVATSAFAAERTVTLEIGGMTCASCAYIVKHTLADVHGVTAVEVSFAERSAVVTYDDGKTEVADLIIATSSMGFSSTLEEQAQR